MLATYTDKQSDDDEHGGQVDGNHRLEVFVFVEVCAVADQAEDDGGNEDIHEDTEQLSSEDDFHLHFLNLLVILLGHESVDDRVLSQDLLPGVDKVIHYKVDKRRVGAFNFHHKKTLLDIKRIPFELIIAQKTLIVKSKEFKRIFCSSKILNVFVLIRFRQCVIFQLLDQNCSFRVYNRGGFLLGVGEDQLRHPDVADLRG